LLYSYFFAFRKSIIDLQNLKIAKFLAIAPNSLGRVIYLNFDKSYNYLSYLFLQIRSHETAFKIKFTAKILATLANVTNLQIFLIKITDRFEVRSVKDID